MDLLDAIVLGIIEGITEYLPVSSTGHLIIASWLMGLDENYRTKIAVDTFNIVIQGGAILAVLGLYRARVAQMIGGLLGRDDAGRRLFFNLVIAFLPAAMLGPFLDDVIEARLFRPIPVISALFLGGVLLLFIGRWQRRLLKLDTNTTEESENESGFLDIESLSWRQALMIGLMQCVAMWPGTSRSMMTIVGGMVMGLRPRQAAEFGFLLGLPTLGGACAFKLLKVFTADDQTFIADLGGWMPLIVGLVVATISAMIAIRWLVAWLNSHGLGIFGWWRIGVAAMLALVIWIDPQSIEPPQPLDEVAPGTSEVLPQTSSASLKGHWVVDPVVVISSTSPLRARS
ncbi:MAG: UDP-diphosphatase [Phycisphaerae bacterium]|nr:UDP-diphosphatase [Phycisphaerae bacterium]